jgi:hypothetical protein
LKWGAAAGTALLLGGCGRGPETPGSGRYSLYLSTDDGPLRCSGNIDAVVREFRVPLAAFVVGKHARSGVYRSYLDAYRSNPYVTLANHSYSHADGRYSDYYRHPRRVLEDFEKNRRILNLSDKKGRLPGRDSWRIGGRAYDADRSATAAADLLAAHGYTLYGWDLEWTHTHSGRPVGSARQLYRKTRYQLERNRTFTPGHLMLLMHDRMFGTVGAREELKKLILLLLNDPEIRLRELSDYPAAAVQRRREERGAKLIRSVPTGVGETTPVDPLKFAH